MKDLRLNEDRKTLKRVLEHAIPQTLQDVVLIYASVTGTKEGEFFEESYVKKIYPQCIKGKLWSAIQVTTASSVCCVMDLVLKQSPPRGRHPGIDSLNDFLANDFESISDEYHPSRSGRWASRPSTRRQHGQALVVGPCARLIQSVNPATGKHRRSPLLHGPGLRAYPDARTRDVHHLAHGPCAEARELVRLIGQALREKKDHGDPRLARSGKN